MNMLLAAILGFAYIEIRAVRSAMRKHDQVFDLRYYLRRNVLLLLMNAIGTALLYMMAPAVMIVLRYFVRKYTSDELLVGALTDYVLTPVVGGLIGLVGSWVVRVGVSKFKKKASAHPPRSKSNDDE